MATKREQLERLTHDMKQYADDIDAKGEPMTAEQGETLKKMGEDVLVLVNDIKAAAKAGGTLDVASAFLAELGGSSAAKSSDPAPGEVDSKSGIVNPTGMTLGEAFAKSPAYEDFLGQFRGSDGRIRNVQNIKSQSYDVPGGFGFRNTKTIVTGLSSTSGGAFIQNQQLGVVSDLIGERRLTVDALCTHVQINSDTFEYVTITGKTNNAAAVIEATTAADSTVYGTPEAGNVQGYKPESALTLAVVTSPVETLAHLIPITRRAAADAPQARDLVNAFMLYGLAEEREDQILNGSGTSPNLRGIMNTVGINTVGSAGTDLDAVVAAIAAIVADNRYPNAIVVNPADWYTTGFLLAKDTAGNYLVGDPRASIDQLNSLWGMRVVVTPAQTADTLLVGDFKQAVVADRQQATLYVSDSHKDWFGRNILAILAEERLGFGVLDPEAFCTVTSV